MSLVSQGIALIANPTCLLLMVLGVFVGIVFGAIPGLTATMAVTMFLPFTYGLSDIQGVTLLIALYVGGISGGLISAILLKIPGTPSSLATCFDGHPMAARGEAAKAIAIGVLYSCIGTLISWIALITISPFLANLAIKFSMTEYFAVSVFSLSMVSALVKGSPVKGLMSCFFGIMISTIGQAPVDGAPRFTFGQISLLGGISQLPILLGFFAITEVMAAAEKVGSVKEVEVSTELKPVHGLGVTMQEFIEQFGNMIRSALIGVGIGILPGIGAGTSNIISYTVAQNASKHPEKFGTGIIDGLVASETANNASVGGALIPMLTLGIPGDTVTAILLGGLTLHGINAGPMLFTTKKPFVGAIFCAFLICTIIMYLMEFGGLRVFVKLLKVPKFILLPVVTVLCIIGGYGVNSQMFDVYCVLAFGAVGYIMHQCGFPFAPAIMGFILGKICERNLLRGLMLHHGSFLPFLSRPITLVFLIIAVCALIWGFAGNRIIALISKK